MTNVPSQPPGWYHAQGDPADTQRYWDGSQWQGGPQPVAGNVPGGATMVGGAQIASGGKRILARIIDGVIWVIITIPAGLIFGAGAVASGGFGNDTVSAGSLFIAGIINAALVVAYEVFCTANLGATPGKLALGMKTRKEDGSPADLNTAIMRMVPYAVLTFAQAIPILGIIASLVFLVLAIAGLVMLFTDDRAQTPWDKVGKTIVVEG
ncbi:MAG: RDD family protein [Acidimicrobiales bacterium]